ncbi:MAG: helix-turn-helix domain-containing protein [Deltaproteobacteria bacterium]|nr:helix-turn-helix domain-containing protein [Deltaproteobacteria bacterium]
MCALALKCQGWQQRRTAEALGVSEATVSQWLSWGEDQGEEVHGGHDKAVPTTA